MGLAKNTKLLYLLIFFVSFQFGMTGSYAAQKPTAVEDKEAEPQHPNIVFLISEDNSVHFMNLFHPDGVETPHIGSLADEGVVFNHAFSNSPVCSVARSTLITGTLAPRTGIHLHRKIKEAPMPEGLEMFPAYLKKAGYYTTNMQKKDYNAVEGEGVWDESSGQASWRNRKDPQAPFFHKETFIESHESRLHFDEKFMETHQPKDDPKDVSLFPIYPDTPTFRFTTAYHRDKIREIDAWVGEVLGKLDEDGLLDDTFVFYFGDHGGVLPGSKGYLYETGLHVPLVVRIPKNWLHLVDHQPGSRDDGFVSFVDFGATALHLAGIAVPGQVDGKPFLGLGLAAEVEKRDEVLGYADRFDEKYELVRSLRKGKWKYIRSYQPFYPDALHNNYRYQMLAFSEWRNMFYKGELDSLQARFFMAKPNEMLFDLEKDPMETHNLANSPAHKETLSGLRNRLKEKLLAINDLGFLPESVLVDQVMENPVKFGEGFHGQLENILTINDWSLLSYGEARPKLQKTLEEGSGLDKYWALNVASIFGSEAKDLVPQATGLLRDDSNMVRLKAVEFLGISGYADPFEKLISLINETGNPVEALQMLNTLVYFRDHSEYALLEEDVAQIQPVDPNEEVLRRMSYLKGTWK